jgi:hypothetical protein
MLDLSGAKQVEIKIDRHRTFTLKIDGLTQVRIKRVDDVSLETPLFAKIDEIISEDKS